MTQRSRDEWIGLIKLIDEINHQKNPVPKCLHCEHFVNTFCNKWQAEIPPSHWRDGCGEFIDCIPF